MGFNLLSRRALFRTLTLSGLAAMALLTGCSKFDNSQSTLNGPQVTAKFFDAQFNDPTGKPVNLAALRGKTIVINFWSTWCPPCVEEMPMFSDVQTAYKDKNVVFVGIAADQADNVKTFLQKTPVNYLIAIGGQPAFELSQALGNRHDAVPFTLMINAKEGITSRHFGVYTRKDLEADIAKALK
ncbi:MAG: TlpA family protein disulfide reductase [Fluviibacter sp.]